MVKGDPGNGYLPFFRLGWDLFCRGKTINIGGSFDKVGASKIVKFF
jgi:hypothetical protein